MHLYVYIQVASIPAKKQLYTWGGMRIAVLQTLWNKNQLRSNSRTEETIFTVTGFM